MLWLNRDLTVEQKRQLDVAIADHEVSLEEYKLDLRRESRKEIQGLKDQIEKVTAENDFLKTLKYKANDLYQEELELNRRDVVQDNREELLDQREGHLDEIKSKNEEDYKYHHDLANQYQSDAKEHLARAKDELTSAKSESRAAGEAAGFAKGYESGVRMVANSADAARSEANDTAKLLALVTTANRTIVAGSDTDKQDPASKALADAFAKHLTSTIDKVMTPKKDTK